MARANRSSPAQRGMFAVMPPGLEFREEFVGPAEETRLIEEVARLPFRPFEFHGWTGNRETVSFGWRYDFNQAQITPAPPIPDFLLPLRERAAGLAGIGSREFEQALVIRYGEGAGSAGIVIVRCLTRSSAFRCYHPACCDSGAGAGLISNALRSAHRRARPICLPARFATRGNTASRRWK